MKKTVCELFAGVGGFRLGFEKDSPSWETVWFSQWEPGKTKQWAHDCYVAHWGDFDAFTGIDISQVDKSGIPDHNLLVGGFPCQDYSVAHPLSSSKGLEGKKGVLWWQIRDTLIAKQAPFCLFENVDRLLKSPATQRGRDFGVILSCLADLGYRAEWRVINAADYGSVQRRRRTFIFAYHKDTAYAKEMDKAEQTKIIRKDGLFAQAFPASIVAFSQPITMPDDPVEVSEHFKADFRHAGFMRDGIIYNADIEEAKEEPVNLGTILQTGVDEKYYIPDDKRSSWQYLKGSKKVDRTSKEGYTYTFSEGAIAYPDPWDKPGRTMLTSEGTLNRSSHVVADKETGRLRILTPVEAERMQGFDDDWTNKGMPERMRYFCMGNALVVPMITRMAKVLDGIFEKEP